MLAADDITVEPVGSVALPCVRGSVVFAFACAGLLAVVSVRGVVSLGVRLVWCAARKQRQQCSAVWWSGFLETPTRWTCYWDYVVGSLRCKPFTYFPRVLVTSPA